MTLLELFNSLSLASIDEFINERQEEHLSLEFKTASSDLTSGDKKNVAELLSGFSNSAGGITVWGVGTRKDQGGRDVAADRKPISNIERFVTRLRELTPLLLAPANAGVLHRSFAEADGSGYAATFVPESEIGPHMALAGHHRYFKRAGERFYRLEHFDIADMFGRRQRAVLTLVYSMTGGPSQYGPEGTKRAFHLRVSLRNEGRASVAAPFAHLHAAVPFEVRRYGASSKAHGEAQFEVLPDGGRTMSFVASTSVLLHPKMELPIAEVHADFWDYEPLPSCTVAYSHAAMDVALSGGTIVADAEDIARQLGRPVDAEPRPS
ncbi:MAG TPA: hypothetical protein VLC46_28575 [Thermoanaerobaculia bacterium]|jgi:hypothetical protein|nr:hypothetical protein [Thermoanaerobaculia bacterium]